MQTKFIEQTRVQVATIPFFKAMKKIVFGPPRKYHYE